MPVEGEMLYKTREEILEELREGMIVFIPDVYLGEDSNIGLLFQVVAGVEESVFQSIQVISEDMFVATANESALERHGFQVGRPRKLGTPSVGELLFSGDGGTVIPLGAEVAYDAGTGEDPLYFNVTESGTIPSPGTPTAPTVADGGAGALGAGTYEYAISFITAEGETELGAISAPLVLGASKQVSVTNIPLGGVGTTQRKVYRRLNGGSWVRSQTIANNTATTVTDNNAAPTGDPVEISTAERIRLDGESESAGEIYNVLPGTITVPTDTPDGVVAVTNPASFIGGTDKEDLERYREQVLKHIRAPGTGSPLDIEVWAEEIDGVDSATVFSNDNMGTPTNGHVTVRIAGPGGSVPGAPVVAAVLANLQSKDIANVTFHVGTFTPLSTDVTVDVTTDTGYTVGDVTPAVQEAVSDFINNQGVGQLFVISGIVASVYGLPGVVDAVVTVPGANQTTAATEKRVPGTITVN